ncbi:hypothetical protein [Nonomuraea sp. B5E05]|uniref:hypothetical protein n=1 Tax=Nonomuraea sp. B5E05 TaxID=3153569 RepID=UPI003260AA66
MHNADLGTLLRICDAVGACLAVPRLPWMPEALAKGNTLHQGACVHWVRPLDRPARREESARGASLNVAVAGSLVLYELAGFS